MLDLGGLREDVESAARQPDFAVVRGRARRMVRRHRAASAGAVLSVTLVAAGMGYAVTGVPGSGEATGPTAPATAPVTADTTAPAPSPRGGVGEGRPRVIGVTAGDADHLYVVVHTCRECDPELRASADGGRTWQSRRVPPAVTGIGGVGSALSLTAHGPDALSWVATPTVWVSSDGARTWRRAALSADPVDAVGGNAGLFGCLPGDGLARCRPSIVDVVRGRVAPLANGPAGFQAAILQSALVNGPAGQRLWLSGLDPTSRKPAVATSGDGGRTWSTHVFAAGVPAEESHGGGPVAAKFLPTLAATAGGTAYALILRDDAHQDAYRTTDGGRTWRSVPGAGAFGTSYWSYATADGRHVVVVMNKRHGADLWVSESGRAYRRAVLPGYPTAPGDPGLTPVHPVEGRYVEWTDRHLYLSEDGWRWRSVPLP
jgi:hypothetical protein